MCLLMLHQKDKVINVHVKETDGKGGPERLYLPVKESLGEIKI